MRVRRHCGSPASSDRAVRGSNPRGGAIPSQLLLATNYSATFRGYSAFNPGTNFDESAMGSPLTADHSFARLKAAYHVRQIASPTYVILQYQFDVFRRG